MSDGRKEASFDGLGRGKLRGTSGVLRSDVGSESVGR